MTAIWRESTVGEFVERGEAEVKTGPFGTQLRASDYVESGTPVINVRNIGFGSIRPEKLEYIDEDTVQRLSSHLLEPGDIVFGRKGAVERHVLIRENQNRWFQGSDCIRLRVKSCDIDSEFLSYLFLTQDHQRWMQNQGSHGATMASLNQDIINRIPLRLPPLKTQRQIADILSAYDDLIENNTRRIQILEEMARTIYREWFVHFRYPGHASTPLVDSPIGPVPEGWEVKTFGGVTENHDRFRVPLSGRERSTRQGQFPYYGAAKIFDYIDDYIFDGKFLLVAEDGSVMDDHGHPLVRLVNEQFWANNHVHVVQTIEPVTTEFLYLAMTNVTIRGYITGAAQPKLNQTNMNSVPVVVPTTPLLDKFQAIVEPIFDQQNALNRRCHVLQDVRDLLLPRLISGQIDIASTPAIPVEVGA